MNAAAAVDQRRIRGCRFVRMHGLQGVHQHASDVIAVAQYTQGVGMHVVQSQCVRGWRHGVARAGLHIVPPAVVGASEANDFAFAAVVARQANRLHYSFSARHVEGNFLHARYFAQAFDVVQHTGVVRAEHGAELLCALHTLGDTLFVKVQPEQVHTIRAGDIKETVAVHIGQVSALAFAPKTTQCDVLTELFAKLERHPVLADQLQVGNHGFGLGRHGQGLRAFRSQPLSQFSQGDMALLNDFSRCLVGGKPVFSPVAVSRYPACDPLGHAQMSTQRWVLGHRQLQSLVQFFQQHCASQRRGAQCQCVDGLHQTFPFKTSFV